MTNHTVSSRTRDRNTANVSRTEIVLIGAALCVALVVRCLFPSCMAIEHFDEGVYASNIWFGSDQGFQYPLRHLYAPPLFPWLVEWSIILFGPSGLGPMVISVLVGSATIGLIWWVGRSWFGPHAGMAAAVLAAFNDLHLFYSRTALTDVLLTFWLLLAVYLIWESLRHGHLAWVTSAAVVTGLAWSTKYNGWLPLAIGLAGSLPWVLLHQRTRGAAGRVARVWAAVAGGAFLVWSPVLYSLQDHGGYSTVAANHRTYLVGLEGWLDAFLRQWANLRHYDGWLTCISFGLAVVAAGFVATHSRLRFTWNGGTAQQPKTSAPLSSKTGRQLIGWGLLGLLLAAAVRVVGSPVLLAVLAVVGCLTHLGLRPSKRAAAESELHVSLAGWLLAAWFLGLIVAVPLYRPYPRLTLPWLVACWLGAAAALDWLLRTGLRNEEPGSAIEARQSSWRLSWVWTAMLVGIVALSLVPGHDLTAKAVPGWQPRTSLAAIAGRIAEDVGREHSGNTGPVGANVIVYVYGEPGLFFHLRAQGLQLVGPISDLRFAEAGSEAPPRPTYLATGPQAHRRSPTFAEQFARCRERFQLVTTYPYLPSDLVLLDECSPDELASHRTQEIRLFRLR